MDDFQQRIHMGPHVWTMPAIPNVTGRWYDPDGNEIGADMAQIYTEMSADLAVATDNNFHDPLAFVYTSYVPCDILPARDEKKPHIYATAEGYTSRRFMQTPKMRIQYTLFAQNRVAARANHDQAVKHVETMVRRHRAWWRRIYLPRIYWLLFLTIGGIQWSVNLLYGVIKLIDMWSR